MTPSLPCALVAALLALGCSRTPPDTRPESHLAGGELVFSDDFERAELGDGWTTKGKTWRLVEGVVADDGARNVGLWLTRELPMSVRVEFDAMSLTPASGAFRGDMKCEAFGTAREHQSGYVFVFGGWENRISIIARLDEHGDDRQEKRGLKVEADRWYHWTIVRKDGKIHWFIDRELFMSYTDPAPLMGTSFGFNNWVSKIRYDKLRVFDLSK